MRDHSAFRFVLQCILTLAAGSCAGPDVAQVCVITPGASDSQHTAEVNQCIQTIGEGSVANEEVVLQNGKWACDLPLFCLDVLPAVVNGVPLCLVGIVDADQPDALPDQYLSQCSSECCQAMVSSNEDVWCQPLRDPSIITACNPEPQDCYCAATSPLGICSETVMPTFWLAGNAALPSNKVVSFRCAGTRPNLAPM